MPDVVFMELGFPILLLACPMVEIWGEQVPDVDMGWIQDTAYDALMTRPERLTGAQVRFIRHHHRMRQADLARVLNLANHSAVSVWESREDDPAGMDYNTEVLLRVWMAAKTGRTDRLLDLLEKDLKGLRPDPSPEPLRIAVPRAA